MAVAPIYYYDFWVAAPNSNPRDWKYQAWKIAAKTPKMAICVKMLFVSDLDKMKTENALILARMSIRRIVEYELSHQEGKTKYRFKKRAEYYIMEDLKIKDI